jgi:hypothetical protein
VSESKYGKALFYYLEPASASEEYRPPWYEVSNRIGQEVKQRFRDANEEAAATKALIAGLVE